MLKPAPYILVLSLLLILAACADKPQQKGDKSKQQATKGQQGSVINKELNKQYQMYKEIQSYEQKQEEKVAKESEERVKKLEKENKKKEKAAKEKEKKKKKKP